MFISNEHVNMYKMLNYVKTNFYILVRLFG